MKKIYVSPLMEVMQVQSVAALLDGSSPAPVPPIVTPGNPLPQRRGASAIG